MIFCSTERIPNEEFTKEVLLQIAGRMGREAKSYLLQSKSGWKQLLEREEVSEVVLLGVSNPAEYEVPPEGMVDMRTSINHQLISIKFQVVDGKGVLVIPSIASAQAIKKSGTAGASTETGKDADRSNSHAT